MFLAHVRESMRGHRLNAKNVLAFCSFPTPCHLLVEVSCFSAWLALHKQYVVPFVAACQLPYGDRALGSRRVISEATRKIRVC